MIVERRRGHDESEYIPDGANDMQMVTRTFVTFQINQTLTIEDRSAYYHQLKLAHALAGDAGIGFAEQGAARMSAESAEPSPGRADSNGSRGQSRELV